MHSWSRLMIKSSEPLNVQVFFNPSGIIISFSKV